MVYGGDGGTDAMAQPPPPPLLRPPPPRCPIDLVFLISAARDQSAPRALWQWRNERRSEWVACALFR
eukprot:8926974-Alexandrium_andersonii.AAC.1